MSRLNINLMRELGKINYAILNDLKKAVVPGMSTLDLDTLCKQYLQKYGVSSSCYGYQGFPGQLCISVNEVACHGVPNDRILRNGDILNLDLAINHKDVNTDCSIMVTIGHCDAAAQKLIQAAQACLYAGINKAAPGVNLLEIASSIQQESSKWGFCINEDFCGHGIGSKMHQEPTVYHTVPTSRHERNQLASFVLKEGFTFTIEPIVMEGSPEISIGSDMWSAIAVDGKRSAVYEHTLLVTKTGVEILTSD